MGDVLTRGAVAAGGGADQFPVAVEQVDGQAVDLEFGQPRDRGGAESPSLATLASALAEPGLEFLEGEDVLEAVHPLQVLHGGEGRGDFAAHFLGGRIIGHQLRMQRLDFLQPAEQCVELGVGHQGCVVLVIGEPVLPDEVRQILVFVPDGSGRDAFGVRSAAAVPVAVVFCGAFSCAHRTILPYADDMPSRVSGVRRAGSCSTRRTPRRRCPPAGRPRPPAGRLGPPRPDAPHGTRQRPALPWRTWSRACSSWSPTTERRTSGRRRPGWWRLREGLRTLPERRPVFRVRAFGARATCCGGAAGRRRRSGTRGCGGSRRRQDRLRRGRGRCWWARPVGRLRPGGPDGLGGRAGGFQAAVVSAAGRGGGGRRSCGFRRVGQGCASGGEAYRGGQDSCGRRGEDSAERRRREGHCYLSGPAVPRRGVSGVAFQSSTTRRRAANPSIVRPSRGMGFSPGFPAAAPPGFSGPFRGPQCTRGRG